MSAIHWSNGSLIDTRPAMTWTLCKHPKSVTQRNDNGLEEGPGIHFIIPIKKIHFFGHYMVGTINPTITIFNSRLANLGFTNRYSLNWWQTRLLNAMLKKQTGCVPDTYYYPDYDSKSITNQQWCDKRLSCIQWKAVLLYYIQCILNNIVVSIGTWISLVLNTYFNCSTTIICLHKIRYLVNNPEDLFFCWWYFCTYAWHSWPKCCLLTMSELQHPTKTTQNTEGSLTIEIGRCNHNSWLLSVSFRQSRIWKKTAHQDMKHSKYREAVLIFLLDKYLILSWFLKGKRIT